MLCQWKCDIMVLRVEKQKNDLWEKQVELEYVYVKTFP